MKKLLFLAIVTVMFSGCKKSIESNQDLMLTIDYQLIKAPTSDDIHGSVLMYFEHKGINDTIENARFTGDQFYHFSCPENSIVHAIIIPDSVGTGQINKPLSSITISNRQQMTTYDLIVLFYL